jgi:hypothetical protein
MASINPDVVVFAATEAETAIGLQIKAIRAAGYKGKIAKTEELNMVELKGIASTADIEGLVGKVGADQIQPLPKELADFKAAYTAKYREWPTIYYGFLSCMYMFKAAAEKAQSLEVPDIAAAISGLVWQNINGPYMTYYREDIKLNRPVGVCTNNPMGVVKNGELVLQRTYSIEETFAASALVYGVTRTGTK